MFAGGDSAFAAIRTGAEALMPMLLADNLAWSSARAARLAQPAPRTAHPTASSHSSMRGCTTASARTVVPDATVVVTGDRIAAVGDATTPVPAGSRVIDAHGRTLLPGLWDMHVHLQIAEAGLLFLASGVTRSATWATTPRSSIRGSRGSTPAPRSGHTCCAPP